MSVKAVTTLVLFAVLWFCPTGLAAQIFQWTDSRGVIHFTDNLERVPEPVRGSPKLVVRTEADLKAESFQAFGSEPPGEETQAAEPWAPEAPYPAEPEPPQTPMPTLHYNPQYFTIVVNSAVRKPRREHPTFRPSFDDRRFIHPSVFDGSPRQYVRPELFPPPRR